MAICSFRIYMDDGSTRTVVPASLQNNRELNSFDKFVVQCGNTLNVTNSLAQEFGVEYEKIKEVKICQPGARNDVEFSLIVVNPYLTPVLGSTSKKKISGYKDYQYEDIVVATDNEVFVEMKKYLFDKLVENPTQFLNDVYTYNNEFSNLLYRYGTLCKQGLTNEEELRNLEELKDKVIKGLSIYKNYRGLCKARYEYEKGYHFASRGNNNARPAIEIKPREPQYNSSRFPQEPLYDTNQFINDLGEEREEFLEEDELWNDECYGKRR